MFKFENLVRVGAVIFFAANGALSVVQEGGRGNVRPDYPGRLANTTQDVEVAGQYTLVYPCLQEAWVVEEAYILTNFASPKGALFDDRFRRDRKTVELRTQVNLDRRGIKDGKPCFRG